MSDPTTTPTEGAPEGNGDPTADASLGDKFRIRAKEVRAQLDAAEARAKERWAQMPDKLRDAWQQALIRMRVGLDLPSRAEVTSLSARLDELDKRLDQYASKKKPSAPSA